MTQYDNTNKGVLFRNDDKDNGGNDQWPDYRGSINVRGEEFWLSAWVKTSSKDGRKFFSLAIKKKEPKGGGAGKVEKPAERTTTDDYGDEIPF